LARFCVRLACVLLLALVMLPAQRAGAQPFAAAIMDVRTGEFLWETDNAGSRVHPASLTKMMTLYIAFEAIENGEISLDTRVRISRHAAAQPPSRLGLRAGQTIALRYLIRAAALRSANDAATAIAEAIEGSVPNFSRRMNRTAEAIGMTRTRFSNPHGLTAEGHLSTARDMSRLGRQLYFDFPQYYGIFARRSEDAGIATVTNTNSRFLDSYRGADGIKTGFTNAAGYNLTAMAERNGVRILVTVMGARSGADRLRRVTELMNRGFDLAPRRATTRAPGRPDYVRAPEDRGSGPAAGRVIRLQPAPSRSIFPRPRPEPGTPPSEELIAALRDEIDEVIDEIREPDASTDTDDPGVAQGESSEEPEETGAPTDVASAEAASPEAEAPAQVAAGPDAPERSPLPPPRPATMLAALPEDPAQAEATAEATALAGAAPILPDLDPVPAELSVDDEGRVLWRDEELLAALRDEEPSDPVLAPAIVLTTSSAASAPAPAPMPEIVSRSTSGGRLWRVELGVHASRFDAERALLEVALSEAATLGSGVRRVTPTDGRYAAEVESLDQAQAELACARLTARGRTCTVIAP
jgi:D-alanyl-D-alanine carboxypeptidase